MSKIFQALQRGQAEIPELVMSAIDEEQPVVEPSAPESLLAAAPEPQPVDSLGLPPGIGSASPARSEALPIAEPAVPKFRVLPLRISAPTPLLPFDTRSIRASEEYRMVRTKIFQHLRQPRMIVISSAGPRDGKTVTAVNLAGALSLKTESKVLLLDADIRRSSIAGLLGMPEIAGLTELLAGQCILEDAVVQVEQLPNLYLLTAGKHQPNPAELLDSTAWVSLCTTLRNQFRYIIVDSPPVQAVADYDLIQAVCDGVIVVVRPDHTNRTVCQKALKSIPEEKLIGVVLNCVKDWFWTKRDYYYAYRY